VPPHSVQLGLGNGDELPPQFCHDRWTSERIGLTKALYGLANEEMLTVVPLQNCMSSEPSQFGLPTKPRTLPIMFVGMLTQIAKYVLGGVGDPSERTVTR